MKMDTFQVHKMSTQSSAYIFKWISMYSPKVKEKNICSTLEAPTSSFPVWCPIAPPEPITVLNFIIIMSLLFLIILSSCIHKQCKSIFLISFKIGFVSHPCCAYIVVFNFHSCIQSHCINIPYFILYSTLGGHLGRL